MTNLTFIVDVIFAVYLTNFLSGFFHTLAENWSAKSKNCLDLIIGIALLVAVILIK